MGVRHSAAARRQCMGSAVWASPGVLPGAKRAAKHLRVISSCYGPSFPAASADLSYSGFLILVCCMVRRVLACVDSRCCMLPIQCMLA